MRKLVTSKVKLTDRRMLIIGIVLPWIQKIQLVGSADDALDSSQSRRNLPQTDTALSNTGFNLLIFHQHSGLCVCTETVLQMTRKLQLWRTQKSDAAAQETVRSRHKTPTHA